MGLLAKKKGTAFAVPFETKSGLLFLIFFFLDRLDAAIVLGLRFGLFHRLLGLGDFLGADFGALFAFFVQHFFAAQQLEESLIGAVALVPSRADDARVASIAIAEAGADGVEQLHDGLVGHEIRSREPPRRQVAALPQRDHLLDDGLRGLGLGNGRLDTLLDDNRRDQVPQQRAPVRGVPSEFVACYFVAHGGPQWSVASGQWPVFSLVYLKSAASGFVLTTAHQPLTTVLTADRPVRRPNPAAPDSKSARARHYRARRSSCPDSDPSRKVFP